MKGAVGQRVNITAVRHITGTWLVQNNMQENLEKYAYAYCESCVLL
jgi:hypothetical protein